MARLEATQQSDLCDTTRLKHGRSQLCGSILANAPIGKKCAVKAPKTLLTLTHGTGCRRSCHVAHLRRDTAVTSG